VNASKRATREYVRPAERPSSSPNPQPARLWATWSSSARGAVAALAEHAGLDPESVVLLCEAVG
jgi:hypothetical protein